MVSNLDVYKRIKKKAQCDTQRANEIPAFKGGYVFISQAVSSRLGLELLVDFR